MKNKLLNCFLSGFVISSAIVGCGSGAKTPAVANFVVSYKNMYTNQIQSFAYVNANYQSISNILGNRYFLKYGHTDNGLGLFIAQGESGLMYSSNGLNWNTSTNPCPNALEYGFDANFIPNNHLIGYCYDKTQDLPFLKALYSSKDGESWVKLWQDDKGKELFNLNYLNGKLFTIACENYDCTEQKPYTLDNGIWNELTIYSRTWEPPNNALILGVATDGKNTLLVQNKNDEIFKSIDAGFTWEKVSIPGFDGKEVSDLSYKDSTKLFYISHAGTGGSFMSTSSDASRWNTYSMDYPFLTFELTFNKNLGYLGADMEVFDIQQSPLSNLGDFTPLTKQPPVNQEFYFAQSIAGSY